MVKAGQILTGIDFCLTLQNRTSKVPFLCYNSPIVNYYGLKIMAWQISSDKGELVIIIDGVPVNASQETKFLIIENLIAEAKVEEMEEA